MTKKKRQGRRSKFPLNFSRPAMLKYHLPPQYDKKGIDFIGVNPADVKHSPFKPDVINPVAFVANSYSLPLASRAKVIFAPGGVDVPGFSKVESEESPMFYEWKRIDPKVIPQKHEEAYMKNGWTLVPKQTLSLITDADGELEARFSAMDNNVVRNIEVAQIAQTSKVFDSVIIPSRMTEFEMTILTGSFPMFEKAIEQCLFATLEKVMITRAQLEKLLMSKKYPIHVVHSETVTQFAPLVYVKDLIDKCIYNKLIDEEGGYVTTQYKLVKPRRKGGAEF